MNNMTFLWIVWGLLLIMYGIMPQMTQKTIAFGARIPATQRQNPFLRTVLWGYWIGEAVAAALMLIIMALIHPVLGPAGRSLMLILLTMGLLTLNYWVARTRVIRRKSQEGWYENQNQASAAVPNSPEIAARGWWWWELTSWAIIIALAVEGIIRYPEIANRIPTHFNIQGVANAWANKSVLAVFSVLGIAAGVLLLFTGLGWFVIRRARPDLDPGDAKGTALQSAVYRRRMLHVLGVLAVAVTATEALAALSMWGVITHPSPLLFTAPVTLAVIVVFVIALKTGQEGSNVPIPPKDRPQGRAPVHRDDDQYWKAGLFYYNADDPKLFVDKRFGVGWTLNFARPGVWVIAVVILAVAIVPVLMRG